MNIKKDCKSFAILFFVDNQDITFFIGNYYWAKIAKKLHFSPTYNSAKYLDICVSNSDKFLVTTLQTTLLSI